MPIEETAIGFMNARLPYPVYGEYPSNPPAQFVVVHKGGGSRSNFLNTVIIVADSYGSSKAEAGRMNERVKAALDALLELPEISGAHLTNDYPAFDTKNNKHRYQAVYDVTHY